MMTNSIHGSIDLVGTWKLTSYAVIDKKSNEQTTILGVVGSLIYTEEGYMSVLITREESKVLSLKDVIAYSGKYHVEVDTVFHHVSISCSSKLVGTTQVRRILSCGGGYLFRL